MAAEFITPLKMLLFVYVIAVIVAPSGGFVARKLDNATAAGPPDSDVKCSSGCSSCIKPCQVPPPPLPPVLPPPLPPVLPPPPPPPKKPPTPKCPPPPCQTSPCVPSPPSYIYITGPPGSLYPIDQYYSGTGRSSAGGAVALIGWGLIALLAF